MVGLVHVITSFVIGPIVDVAATLAAWRKAFSQRKYVRLERTRVQARAVRTSEGTASYNAALNRPAPFAGVMTKPVYSRGEGFSASAIAGTIQQPGTKRTMPRPPEFSEVRR